MFNLTIKKKKNSSSYIFLLFVEWRRLKQYNKEHTGYLAAIIVFIFIFTCMLQPFLAVKTALVKTWWWNQKLRHKSSYSLYFWSITEVHACYVDGLTVLLVGHFESQVFLLQFLVGLLQVADVVDGFPQHCRFIQLEHRQGDSFTDWSPNVWRRQDTHYIWTEKKAVEGRP